MKMNITNLILFLLFALVVPCGYLIIRYDLFTSTTRLNIGLWGVIVIFILIGVVTALIYFYLEGMKCKYSLLKQILEGTIKVILPLLAMLGVVVLLKDNVDKLIEALCVIIPSEIIAIIFNPFPKWCFENNIEGIGNILDKLKITNKNEETKEGE